MTYKMVATPVWASLARAGRFGGLLLEAVCASGLARRRPHRLHYAPFAAILLAAVLYYDRDIFRCDGPMPNDAHALLSLEMAVNRHAFDEVSALKYSSPNVYTNAIEPSLWSERVLDLPQRCGLTREEYGQELEPFLNNENSLMLLEYALLWLMPDLTLQGLAQAQLVLKVACLVLFALLLLRVGLSPLLAAATLHLGLLLLAKVNETRPLSMYPLLPPVVLLLLFLLGLALATGVHRRAWTTVPALAVAGALSCFLCNLRTSYTPLAAALVLLYMLVATVDVARRHGFRLWRAGGLAALALVAFAGGYCLFSQTCIDPIKQACADCSNYAHHVVGHPLVLALGVIPNKLAEREGIEWEDGKGLDLARRIDPEAKYLQGHYDDALLTYYVKLWLYYPDEMRDLYAAKLDIACTDGFRYLSELREGETESGEFGLGAQSAWLVWPLDLLSTGARWLLAFASLAALAVLASRWLGAGAAFALAGLAITGTLLLLEATAVIPFFDPQYQDLLLYSLLLTGLLPYQLGLDGVAWLVRGVAWLVRPGRRQDRDMPPPVALEPPVAA